MAYDTAGGWRAEVRDAGGVVRGVFGYPGPAGQPVTQSYLSDSRGYRSAGTKEPVNSNTDACPQTGLAV